MGRAFGALEHRQYICGAVATKTHFLNYCKRSVGILRNGGVSGRWRFAKTRSGGREACDWREEVTKGMMGDFQEWR